MKKILLIIDYSIESDRELLRGLVRYSKEHEHWIFHKMSSHLEDIPDGWQYVIDWAKQWKADAIIGHWLWKETKALSELNIPVVLENHKKRSSLYSNLTGDYFGTGVIAARFFLSRRYTDFAYFGLKDVIWSEERLEGYKDEIERNGGHLYSMMVTDANKERRKVFKWLNSLPKPIALFACNDEHALFISEYCKMGKIPIPEMIALLGVDNDELLCEISDPRLSSIAINVEQGGYKLGEMLNKQFEAEEMKSFDVVINPGEIIQRESTRKHNIKDPHIEKIAQFIDKNFDQSITTAQVFSLVPLSRRSVEIRFKKEMDGVTVYSYIMLSRMHRFADLLATTDYSIMEISEMCGTLNYSNVSRIFKKTYGCSPSEYRALKKAGKA